MFACGLRRVTATTSDLSGMTGMSSWFHLFFRFFLLLCGKEACGCLSPLLVTLPRFLPFLFGIALLNGVTVEFGRGTGKLGVCGAGGHILFISANLPGPMCSM